MSGRIPRGNDCGQRHAFESEVCGCILEPGHIDPASQVMHECSCGRRWGTVQVALVADEAEPEPEIEPERPTALALRAAPLIERYAGFVGAETLTPVEQLAAVASLVPMALDVVDEARDTIERLNGENDALRAQAEAERA